MKRALPHLLARLIYNYDWLQEKLKHPQVSAKDHPLFKSLFGTIPTQNLETLKRLATDAETPLHRPSGVPSHIILHKRIDKEQQQQNELILQ